MARALHKLSAQQIDRASKPGMYGDGGGLWLQVSPTLTKSWIFRYTLHGKAHEMGLGSAGTVARDSARKKAALCRRQLQDGINPIDARDAKITQDRLDAAKVMTFTQCATAYIEAHKGAWKNAKHADQWTNTLDTYCGPVIGSLPIQAVDIHLVLKVLELIWKTKTETATRVRARMESVLDWAHARGLRTGDNPARWKGNLDKLLPKRSKVQRVKHHAALPYADLPAFMVALRGQEGIAARALEFTILTAARTGEVIGARAIELDSTRKLWTIPGIRMKAGVMHRVPLSPRAASIADEVQKTHGGRYLFPGMGKDQPLSNAAMTALLKRMKRNNITVHGMRSTFRDWAAEQTNHPHEVAESALAHVIGNKSEAAYRRGDALDKRRRLMDDWARYCARPRVAGNVVPIRAKLILPLPKVLM